MDNNLLQTVDLKTDLEITQQGELFLAKAVTLLICDDESNDAAITVLEDISLAKKTVEMHRKRFTSPLLTLKKAFDDHFATLAEPILKADKILRDKVLAFGRGKIRRTWKVEVVNESEVPDDYWSVDERKLKAMVEAGMREIKGCRIYQVESLVVGGLDWGK